MLKDKDIETSEQGRQLLEQYGYWGNKGNAFYSQFRHQVMVVGAVSTVICVLFLTFLLYWKKKEDACHQKILDQLEEILIRFRENKFDDLLKTENHAELEKLNDQLEAIGHHIQLTKQYKNKIAVDRLSFSLTKGVTGLLGANGAGKTTLIRMLCGILVPTSGEITYNGISVSDERYRNVLGYLPQEFGYYPEFTGKDFLMYFAALKGFTKKAAEVRANELLELVGLSQVPKKKIKTYSGGMKQRLGIAQALINRPEVLILDEPTAGLDPKERVRFRNLIDEIGKKSIVLLSTHIVSDIEHIADHIIMMKNGQIIWQGSHKEIAGDLEDFYMEQFDDAEDTMDSFTVSESSGDFRKRGHK